MTISTVTRGTKMAAGKAMAAMLMATTTLGASVILAPPALAQETRSFDVPAGPLADALNRFARQAGVELAYPAQITQGKSSTALRGSYDVTEGLSRLLTGTGVTYRQTGPKAFTLERAPVAQSETIQLGPVRVEGDSGGTGSFAGRLGAPFSAATTEGTRSYKASVATIGKSEVALLDIPQSVTVVTRQRIDDQGLTSLADVLDNVTGMKTYQSAAAGRTFRSRGFRMESVQYDGVPLSRTYYTSGNSFTGNTAIYDRVEVLRGAAGLLEGAGNPSGTVNLVRKRGQADATFSGSLRAGSWDRFGGQVDAGGPLNSDGSLRGRFVADYETRNYFYDVADRRDAILYGALDYDLGPNTVIGVGVSYSRTRGTPFLEGLARYSDGSNIYLPRSTYLGADWNRWSQDETTVYADIEHRFDENWKAKISAIYVWEDNKTKYASHLRIGSVNPVTLTGPVQRFYATDFSSKHVGIDANIDGHFNLIGISHHLTVGVSATRFTSNDQLWFLAGSALDVFNYDPSAVSEPTIAEMELGGGTRKGAYAPLSQGGVYGVVRSDITDRLKIIAGGRINWYKNTYDAALSVAGSAFELSTSTMRANARFTGYGGIIYRVANNWSLYASYADIFLPQSAVTASGDLIAPIVGANYEAGVKGELMDGRLNLAFAAFRIDQTNRAVTDYESGLACSGALCSIATGKVRSQGLEAEMTGELLPGWQLTAGYTFNTVKYVSDPDKSGDFADPASNPRHLFRIWSNYRLPGSLSAITVGGGVNGQSGIYTVSSTVRSYQKAYSIWNARIGYDINKNWEVSANINNIFDKTYFATLGNNNLGNFYGDPRNVLMTIRGRY